MADSLANKIRADVTQEHYVQRNVSHLIVTCVYMYVMHTFYKSFSLEISRVTRIFDSMSFFVCLFDNCM